MIEEKLILSLIIPVYSGEEYLAELARNIELFSSNLIRLDCPIQLGEAIFVCDGPIDKSLQVIKEQQNYYKWVKVINLSRNFGQHPATEAGILHSSGDWVVTIDEDMQHKPEDILNLLKKAILTESDLVYARATTRVHGGIFRNVSSKMFKLVLSILSGNRAVRNFSSFRLIRGAIARAAAAAASYDTYFDVVIGWFTERVEICDLPLKDVRWYENKKSGYGLKQLIKHARRMLITSQVKILRIGTLAGLGSLFISTTYFFVILLTKLLTPNSIQVQGWTTLVILILFFGGLICFLLGISLEYLAVLVHHAQGRPCFFTLDRSQDILLQNWFNKNS